jgi:hypothetical protein
LSATAINANTVDVLFNEALDPISAALVTNYAINNGINITSATLDALNPALVHLSVSTLTNLTNYQLDITDIADLNNNILLNQSLNFSYQVFITPAYQELIFNEIMIDPNPVVNLPDAEYVCRCVYLYICLCMYECLYIYPRYMHTYTNIKYK